MHFLKPMKWETIYFIGVALSATDVLPIHGESLQTLDLPQLYYFSPLFSSAVSRCCIKVENLTVRHLKKWLNPLPRRCVLP